MYVDVVHTNIVRVFDTVNTKLLIRKLHGYEDFGVLLKFFEYLLSNRSQQVKLNLTLSRSFEVTSGVCQGYYL